MAVDINGDGLIAVGGTSTTQGRVRLAEDTDNGTNYVELTANAAITTNRTVTFPDANIDFTTGLSATLGGTGLTSAGTNGNVLTSNGTAWVSQAAAAGGGDYIMQVYNSPATWTKPASLKAVKVTVVAGGGGAAIASPGTASPTGTGATGGTSSFGALLSATGGGGGVASPTSSTPAIGGIGSSGLINQRGGAAGTGQGYQFGGVSIMGGSGVVPFSGPVFTGGAYTGNIGTGGSAQNPGTGCIIFTSAGGAGGYSITYLDAPAVPGPISVTVGSGGAASPNHPLYNPYQPYRQAGVTGIVIVEEFY